MKRALLVLALACGALPAATPAHALAAAQDDGDDAAELGFEELAARLRDTSDKSDFLSYRRNAVKKLAALGTREAWELVIGALEDVAPKVRDEAQIQLGSLADREVLDGLYGKLGLRARDAWVRRRVVEAFGRMTLEIDAEVLAKVATSDDDAEARRMALWSLERLAPTGRLAGDRERRVLPAVLRAHERDKDADVRGAALYALVALDAPDARAVVSAALADDDVPVRCAAVACAPRLEGGEALVARAAADESVRVRTQACRALADVGTRDAARRLAERLEHESELRLRWRIVDLLQRLSGMKYRLDHRPWQRWANELAADWSPAAPGDETDEPDLGGDRSISFAGMPVISERVAFLVDFSGSLWKEQESGRTRKEIVDEKLSAALRSLPPQTLFNVIPYTEDPHPWEDELVEAKPRAVDKALEAFLECTESGTGDFYHAVQVALADPRVDTLMVLTDGAPSGGDRWNLELMIELLDEQGRYRQVAFDSLLVDCPKRLQKHWSELARRTGGRSIAVELE